MFFSKKNAVIAFIILITAIGVAISLLFSESPADIKKIPANKEKKATTEVSKEAEVKTSEDQLKELIKNMSLDQKIGQLFLARVPETNQIEDLKTYHLGGYLLFGRDMENETADSLKSKIASYQEATDFPLLIASDEEGGTVTRISQNTDIVAEKFKSPQELYKSGGIEAIKNDIDHKSSLFKVFGIHTGLYPVADVSTNPDSFIYDRTIGLDTDGTSDYISEVVKELHKNQIGSTLKHFPGSGDNSDSHTEIVHDKRSLEDIMTQSIPPFKAGIDAGADSILVSHNIVEAIDKNVPASISPKVHELIRKDLGFEGVVMTDDMDMNGLSDFISQEEAALAALKAGNDLILSSIYKTQIPVIKSSIQSGDYKEEELDKSVLRVLTWKHELGLISLD